MVRSGMLALTILSLGCRRAAQDPLPGPADATAPSAPATSADPASSGGWPRVVPLAGGGATSAKGAGAGSAGAALDEAPEDVPTESAGESAGDTTTMDASVTDARAAVDAAVDARRDASGRSNDDAALLGTKTFPDETPVRGIRKVTAQAAKVHKAPKDGTAIAVLSRGTEVSLVAELGEWYRVRFSDPNTGVRRQGWLYFVNFAGPRQKTCPEGWTWHPQDGGFCDRECTRNTDCRALKGYKCSGTMCFYAAD